MKITLDQDALAQAVTNHLRNAGVTADIAEVNFRYNRSPFSVFAEVELSEARVKAAAIPKSTVVEKEIVVPAEPIVDPATVSPEEPEPVDAPLSDTPSEPLFGG